MRFRFARRHLDPTRTVVLSFAAVILVGTLLLSLPAATATGGRIRPVDAFFTAASATCVTGLAVFEIGKELSLFGELVVLGCIQVGGLGLMAFTTVFLVASGRRLAIADRIAIVSSFHHSHVESVAPLVRYIVLSTFAMEAIGAAILALHWTAEERFSTAKAMYWGVFHAISAFCNAGFSLAGDNLVAFRHDPLTLITLGLLIVTGGLGFLVGVDVLDYLRQRTAGYRGENGFRPPRLSVHSKLVLLTTGALLVAATPAYYVLERHGVLAGLPPVLAWLNAWFCAVTPRTAGFNTVVFADMGGAALLLTMVLMLIGASPGSTGGGVKTTTFGLLVAHAASRWRGHVRLHIFGRTIPAESVDKASAVVVATIALLVVVCIGLIVVETGGTRVADTERRLVALVFEAVSAFGTVGLSLGATPGLSDAGKVIIALLMFVGRVGPLTLALAIARRRQPEQYRYAEENVMIG